jgi:hypothetical protein
MKEKRKQKEMNCERARERVREWKEKMRKEEEFSELEGIRH